MNGLNCSQAVAVAFADEMNMPKELVAKLTIGFGGGIGRMREVCGAVSGMTFVISALYDDEKSDIYKRVQAVANEYKEEVVNNENQEVIKPDCELIGQDSNIFNLMGIAARTLRENGLDEQAKEMIDKVTNSGNYNEALLAISDYVNIVGPDESEDEGMCMG